MASEAAILSMDNEVFRKFVFYAGVVLLKTVFMSFWTARHRIPKNVFLSPEDYGRAGQKAPQTLTTDPHIERIRRAHQNDLENILPFVLIGLLYVLTGPDVFNAVLHFRVFAGARLLHTIVYLNAIPQPARVLTCFIAFCVNVSMAIAVIRAGTF